MVKRLEKVFYIISILIFAWLVISWVDVIVCRETQTYHFWNAYKLIVDMSKAMKGV